MAIERVVSGMRPTGSLHLGHYNGVLKNWVDLQHELECLFFVADWHALTTHYDAPEIIEKNVTSMVIDWLAAGVDPANATIFIQSKVPEHAELHTLLSMITPLELVRASANIQRSTRKVIFKRFIDLWVPRLPIASKCRYFDLSSNASTCRRRSGSTYRIYKRGGKALQSFVWKRKGF